MKKSILKYFYRLNATLIKMQIQCLETLLFSSNVNMGENSKSFINKILENRREVSRIEVESMKAVLWQSG